MKLQLVLALLLAGCVTGNVINDPQPAKIAFPEGILTLMMLDVGQGQAILIKLPDNETLLYDAGKSGTRLVSYLENYSITTIDYAMISNLDSDHAAGLIKAFDTVKIKNYLQPKVPCDTKTCASLNTKAEIEGSVLLDWHDGQSFLVGGAQIDVLNPDTPLAFNGDNDNSIVLKITYKNTSILLPGDCESACEHAVINQYGAQLESDVYVAGHHGSKTSSTAEFVSAINPSVALISVGLNNQYGHPGQEVMTRLNAQTDNNVYRTDEKGTLTLTTDGNKFSLSNDALLLWRN